MEIVTRMYRVVMNPRHNPLSNLPPQQRFQIMLVLSVMWSTIFCAVAGLWFYYGALVLGHLLLVLGVFATAMTFRSARQRESARGGVALEARSERK